MTTAAALRRTTSTPQDAPTAKQPDYDSRLAQPQTPVLTQDQLLDLLEFSAAKHLSSL